MKEGEAMNDEIERVLNGGTEIDALRADLLRQCLKLDNQCLTAITGMMVAIGCVRIEGDRTYIDLRGNEWERSINTLSELPDDVFRRLAKAAEETGDARMTFIIAEATRKRV
jgi:hypothetical protein